MADAKNALEELKWIEDKSLNQRPEFEDSSTSTLDRSGILWKKLTENMLVPIGLAATTACLTLGLISMNRGDTRRQQLFMRGRVGFQLFTFVTMVATVALTGRKRGRRNE